MSDQKAHTGRRCQSKRKATCTSTAEHQQHQGRLLPWIPPLQSGDDGEVERTGSGRSVVAPSADRPARPGVALRGPEPGASAAGSRYRLANFTKAQPLFRCLARLGRGKVIPVSVLTSVEVARLW